MIASMPPPIGYDTILKQEQEQESRQMPVLLPGVLIEPPYIFNGVDLQTKELREVIATREMQLRANLVLTDQELEKMYEQKASRLKILKGEIRNVMPDRSRIIIKEGDNGEQSAVTLEVLEMKDINFMPIQKVKIPKTPFWPAIITELDQRHEDEFLSITEESIRPNNALESIDKTQPTYKLNIHNNYKAGDIIGLKDQLATVFEAKLTKEEPSISLKSGDQIVFKSNLIDKNTVAGQGINYVRIDEEELVLLCHSMNSDNAIEIRIPIPKDSGFIKYRGYSIISKHNTNHQYNLNILGALLTNLTAATKQLAESSDTP